MITENIDEISQDDVMKLAEWVGFRKVRKGSAWESISGKETWRLSGETICIELPSLLDWLILPRGQEEIMDKLENLVFEVTLSNLKDEWEIKITLKTLKAVWGHAQTRQFALIQAVSKMIKDKENQPASTGAQERS